MGELLALGRGLPLNPLLFTERKRNKPLAFSLISIWGTSKGEAQRGIRVPLEAHGRRDSGALEGQGRVKRNLSPAVLDKCWRSQEPS